MSPKDNTRWDMYRASNIIIVGDDQVREMLTNLGMRQGCNMSPVTDILTIHGLPHYGFEVFNVMHNLNKSPNTFKILFANDQTIS